MKVEDDRNRNGRVMKEIISGTRKEIQDKEKELIIKRIKCGME